MRIFSTVCVAFVALLCLASCASSHLVVTKPSDENIPIDAGERRLFLVGDAGEENEIFARNVELLRARLKASEIPATVLYLGDNIYPSGVPNKEDSAAYASAVSVLNAQIDAVDGLADETLFVPGNHDWHEGKAGGLKAIRREGKLIKDSDASNVSLLPRKGCPGPEVVELTDDVVLLLIDSQWWLQDWSTEKDINDDCEIRNRADFLASFNELLKDYQEQQVIVAMHHPLVSSGSHGGYFTVEDHLFPLTNLDGLKKFYLPLPVIGSIYPIFRSNFGSVQDIVNHKYQDLKKGMLMAARLRDNVIFVSGHEHALEYHEIDNHRFVVSGAGSRTSKLGKPSSMRFGHGAPGFVQFNLKPGGAVEMLIWESANGVTDKPVYRAQISPGPPKLPEGVTYPDPATFPDSIDVAISTRYAREGLYRMFFGERYRDIYEIPVPAKVLDLESAHGGLTPVKKGGGMQTNSLRLESADGREYSARSMNKDASKMLPKNLQNTFASDIVQDQFTASHPYAAFVIPDMAEAAGVYHTNPELVYIPKQAALGAYAEEFGDQLFLLEERPSGDWNKAEYFGNSDDLMNYGDVVEKTMEDYHNRIDQEFVARSRMFDFFLGDWDRHDDQWRWAEFENDNGKGNMYRPIPRDRDQAFSVYDGLVVTLAKAFTPLIRKLGIFSEDIGNMKWFNDNGKWFDRTFMNALTEEQLVQAAEEVKASISDELIEKSLHQWPPEVFAERGQEIIDILKVRRDRLPEFAARYYKVLSKTMYIHGTNNADYFEITRSPGQTRIRIYDSNKEGDKNELYYDRTFDNDVTHEIQLYALDGRDKIVVNGTVSGGIRTYVVGGESDDKVLVEDLNHAGNIRVQDTQERDDIASGQSISYRRVDDDHNYFERRAFLYDFGIPKIVIAGNPDDGFLIGGGGQWTKYGFQKAPFASQHTITGFFAFATKAFGIDYLGEWTDALGSIDAGLHAGYKGPTFVQNFFGFGNDSEELDDSEDRDFYRVRKSNYSIVPFLRAGQDKGSSLTLRAGFESHEVEENEGRFITTPQSGLNADVFATRQFGVVNLAYQFKRVDNPLITRRGIDFDVDGGVDLVLNEGFRAGNSSGAHRYLNTSLAMYYQLRALGNAVIATRVGAAWHGGDYQFYQGAILGAQENFRGVRKERFVGDRMFYHNTDLRVGLFEWRSYYLPASMGIQLNFDHGRVWLDGEESDTWHYAYGGGIWVSPFQTLMISINYHKSDVDKRFSVATGFLF